MNKFQVSQLIFLALVLYLLIQNSESIKQILNSLGQGLGGGISTLQGRQTSFQNVRVN